jgi:hypothetical protein
VADAAGYCASAVVLMGGSRKPGGSSVPHEAIKGIPWTLEHAKSTIVSRGPGYVFFLATLFRVVDEDAWVVRWAQALLGSLSCVLIALSGFELASRRGLVAGWLAAFHPTPVLHRHLMPSTSGCSVLAGILR